MPPMHEYYFNWLLHVHASLTGKPMPAGHEIWFGVYHVTISPHKILNHTRLRGLRKCTILAYIWCCPLCQHKMSAINNTFYTTSLVTEVASTYLTKYISTLEPGLSVISAFLRYPNILTSKQNTKPKFEILRRNYLLSRTFNLLLNIHNLPFNILSKHFHILVVSQ